MVERREAGFLLPSFLWVVSVLLVLVLSSLVMTRWLWYTEHLEIDHANLVNAQRAARTVITEALHRQVIPASCWHISIDPGRDKADFDRDPQRGCRIAVAGIDHYYWLELIPSKRWPGLMAYQLSLSTHLAQQVELSESYGFQDLELKALKSE